MKWLYKNKEVSESEPPSDIYGFVYILTLKDGSHYIGKKAMRSVVKKPLTKKELTERTNNRLKKWKFVTKESKWRDYTSSSKLFGSRDVVEKKILQFAKSKRHLTYLETKWLFQENVLEDDFYLNDNIGGRFYKGKLI